MSIEDLRFTKEHEWVAVDGSIATVGITDFAQGELGDIVFVELPEAGSEVTMADTMGTIEAVKTVADLYAPVSGVVKEINADLEDNPGVVNQSPYEKGWFLKIELTDTSQLEDLMSHAAYKEMIGAD
jgi:glycine cleavage system H protein